MKKLSSKLFLGLASVAGFLGLSTQFAHAAADTELANALTTTTNYATDNKANILAYIIGVGLVVLVIVLVKAAIQYLIGKMKGAIAGSRRRR